MSPWLRLRAPLDRAVAAVLGVVVAPVVALLAWRIRRADPGPGLVTLPRVGRGGNRFGMHKLRTMRADDGRGLASGARITSGVDPRVTPIGRKLRRLRVDELPQLLDVVTGRMALVGPRPETPELVDGADARWAPVLQARPGIAGPTQLLVEAWEAELLRGPDAQTVYRDQVLPVKLAVDAWYVEHANPWIDLLVGASLVQRFVLRARASVIEPVIRRAVPEASRVWPEIHSYGGKAPRHGERVAG
jgi:lipopolysaccharide/colanic/teichoic acid biosynthesis glycosyltransferase